MSYLNNRVPSEEQITSDIHLAELSKAFAKKWTPMKDPGGNRIELLRLLMHVITSIFCSLWCYIPTYLHLIYF
jgi:hypothetical protein